MKKGLKRYSNIVEVLKAPKGIEFRTLGTQDEPNIFNIKSEIKKWKKGI